jgi:hypothetical protein
MSWQAHRRPQNLKFEQADWTSFRTVEPMTLGNMRANGVRSLDMSCSLCHHRAILSAQPWPDHVLPVPMFGPRMVCTRCGIVGIGRSNTCWQFTRPH